MNTYCSSFVFIVLFLISCNSKPNEDRLQDATEEIISSSEKMVDEKKRRKILFFGDSLTAGYGLDEEESFPSLIQNRIDSLGLQYEVINAGLSGETSAGGKGRINWVLNQPIDVFILELGANDVLRGLDLVETNKNLRAILDEVQKSNPAAELIIAGMEAPPNMGNTYTSDFRTIFASIAKEYDAGLIPFLLEGVAGIPKLNLGDAKHPNAIGQKIVRDNVWRILSSYLDDNDATTLND